MSSSTAPPIRVCVTGANGFIASHIIYQLLTSSTHHYMIQGTVRSLQNGKQQELYNGLLKYDSQQPNGPKLSLSLLQERLHLFEADLNQKGSYKKAIENCRFVLHTASPFKMQVQDPQKDLVDPAVNGTLDILQECVSVRLTQSIHHDSPGDDRLQRIILTSSMAAMFDTAFEEDHAYNEDDWNEVSSLNKNAYYYSKTCAEKAAWNYMNEVESKYGKDFLELAVINPSTVLGEAVYEKQVNQSHEIISQIVNGNFPVIFKIGFVVVDVKDVARAHILAMELDMNNSQRFLPSRRERFFIASDTILMKDLVEYLRSDDVYGNNKKMLKNLPTTKMEGWFGNVLCRVATVFEPQGVRQFLESNLGRPPKIDNSKSRNVLGVKYADWRELVKVTTKFLTQAGAIKLQ
ncbi:hypothetical protein C9374_003983 [Naegleria lovaniensis]|uniref:Thioester reductase (TE) domain-containing protein n=1 Tax=Naegleria lovaniensis TaxID=51637 RepID=A0AA88H6L7_NAELO|nr:uncharacterized protein C9374_003983 [Naegleria lovaniensis]KAG2394219.1 hypothetical protein C9374_003983 [Naegleria lovaniensis]